jgi:hypothetical protein
MSPEWRRFYANCMCCVVDIVLEEEIERNSPSRVPDRDPNSLASRPSTTNPSVLMFLFRCLGPSLPRPSRFGGPITSPPRAANLGRAFARCSQPLVAAASSTRLWLCVTLYRIASLVARPYCLPTGSWNTHVRMGLGLGREGPAIE